MEFLFTLLPKEIESRISIHALAIRQHNENMRIVVSQINDTMPKDFYTKWYFDNDCDNEMLSLINESWEETCEEDNIEYVPFKSLSEAWETTMIDNKGTGWQWCYNESILQTMAMYEQAQSIAE
tara:strand:- start:492 stop:863 length:372 start_codon:yes stop_codon:yes gene_type:complete